MPSIMAPGGRSGQNVEIRGGLVTSNSHHSNSNPNAEPYRHLGMYVKKVLSAWTEVWTDTWASIVYCCSQGRSKIFMYVQQRLPLKNGSIASGKVLRCAPPLQNGSLQKRQSLPGSIDGIARLLEYEQSVLHCYLLIPGDRIQFIEQTVDNDALVHDVGI